VQDVLCIKRRDNIKAKGRNKNETATQNAQRRGQHSFLIEILRCPGVNQDKLTTELKFDKATTARAVKQLEEAGYIERVLDVEDRRSYQLYPIQKGLEFYPILIQLLDRSHQRLTHHLTTQETDQLFTLLRKMNPMDDK